ncbi:MAG: hypothetical protein JRN54_04815 [Nitrososphaerota archaeon]|jgi:hypothetical protein|nr:hypothetical protein [Nitrososphaerota archaeon]
MTNNKRTIRDQLYIEALRKHGALSINQLAKELSQNLALRDMDIESIERDIRRWAQPLEKMKLLTMEGGKLYLPQNDQKYIASAPTEAPTPLMLNTKGFLTVRTGVICEHCGRTIDLSKAKPHWRVKSRLILLALQEHRYFRVECLECGWEGKYNTKDVKPIL